MVASAPVLGLKEMHGAHYGIIKAKADLLLSQVITRSKEYLKVYAEKESTYLYTSDSMLL